MQIKPFEPKHLDAVVGLSLKAWTPVFASIKNAMGPASYAEHYPDWRAMQQQAVEDVCKSSKMFTWVAVEDDAVAGFVSVRRHEDDNIGEIYMIAVDPGFQQRGIASTLTQFALDWMKQQGIPTAMVDTGTDPGHAPARRTYEKMGFEMWPLARYFKKL